MIQALIPQLAPILGGVLDRFFPNKEKAAEAQRAIEAALIENSAQINLAQLDVNKEEAKSRSIFVAGWRPAIGWICGLGHGINKNTPERNVHLFVENIRKNFS